MNKYSNINYLYEILCEDKISKIRHKAERYIQKYHWDKIKYGIRTRDNQIIINPGTTTEIVTQIKNLIPTSALLLNQNYVEGIVRILLDTLDFRIEENNKPNDMMLISGYDGKKIKIALEKFIKFIKYSPKIKKEFDSNFSELNITNISDILKYEKEINDFMSHESEYIGNKNEIKHNSETNDKKEKQQNIKFPIQSNSAYRIYEITSWEEAAGRIKDAKLVTYGKLTKNDLEAIENGDRFHDYIHWCITHDDKQGDADNSGKMFYNDSSSFGEYTFYFCLKPGFSNYKESNDTSKSGNPFTLPEISELEDLIFCVTAKQNEISQVTSRSDTIFDLFTDVELKSVLGIDIKEIAPNNDNKYTIERLLSDFTYDNTNTPDDEKLPYKLHCNNNFKELNYYNIYFVRINNDILKIDSKNFIANIPANRNGMDGMIIMYYDSSYKEKTIFVGKNANNIEDIGKTIDDTTLIIGPDTYASRYSLLSLGLFNLNNCDIIIENTRSFSSISISSSNLNNVKIIDNSIQNAELNIELRKCDIKNSNILLKCDLKLTDSTVTNSIIKTNGNLKTANTINNGSYIKSTFNTK